MVKMVKVVGYVGELGCEMFILGLEKLDIVDVEE